MDLFSQFYRISDFYWKCFYKYIYPIVWGVFFVLLFLIILGQYPIFSIVCDRLIIWLVPFRSLQADSGSLNNLISIFSVIITFFAFTISYIGSLSLQFSIVKILVRYKYVQLVGLFLTLLFFYFVFPVESIGIQIVILLFLLMIIIHSLIVADKMFDPEDILIEVIIPDSLNYDMLNSKRGSFSPLDSIFATQYGFDFPIYDSIPIMPLLYVQNPQFDTLKKSFSRLLIQNSFRFDYFASRLTQELVLNHLNFTKYLAYGNELTNRDVFVLAKVILSILSKEVFELYRKTQLPGGYMSTYLRSLIFALLPDSKIQECGRQNNIAVGKLDDHRLFKLLEEVTDDDKCLFLEHLLILSNHGKVQEEVISDMRNFTSELLKFKIDDLKRTNSNEKFILSNYVITLLRLAIAIESKNNDPALRRLIIQLWLLSLPKGKAQHDEIRLMDLLVTQEIVKEIIDTILGDSYSNYKEAFMNLGSEYTKILKLLLLPDWTKGDTHKNLEELKGIILSTYISSL